MTKDEFIKQFSQRGHRSEALYTTDDDAIVNKIGRYSHRMVLKYMDAVPCDCGATECEGWKMCSPGIDLPLDCSVSPFEGHGPFGPPYSLIELEQPTIAFTSSDDAWKRLADVKPAHGQLVEYRGVNPECARKEYASIDAIPRKGHFVTDCGTHWTEMLGGFTTEKLGVIVAPDPEITFWRAVPTLKPADEQPEGEGQLGAGGEFFPIGETESPPLSFTDPPTGMTGSPDNGMASKEPIGLRGADFPFHWSFILDGKTVGELTFNEKTEKLDFSGNAHGSAQILFDLITERFEAWHKEKYGE